MKPYGLKTKNSIAHKYYETEMQTNQNNKNNLKTHKLIIIIFLWLIRNFNLKAL